MAATFPTRATHDSYDVVIVGGAIMGSSTAWFLTEMADFKGRVLVIERDPSYEACSTAHTNSCMRQQFSNPLNIRISQFAAEFVTNLRAHMGGDDRVPELTIENYGYLYLADTEAFAAHLRAAQMIQAAHGAGTKILTPEEIGAAYPFYDLEGIILGSHNTLNEGYFDGGTVFDWWRRIARERGVEYIQGEVVAMTLGAGGSRVDSVTLANGDQIACGQVVNASGPRAARTAAMAGIEIPVEPRKRYTWVFTAETPLDRPLPLTIDPSGIHMRQDGPTTYLAGGHPDHDPGVEPDDFSMDHSFWQEHAWPVIATRIPQFEAIRVVTEWAGHYAYNTLDQNAIIGPHPDVANFHFLNGFSGHGLQQSPAMGRGMAEMLTYGAFQTLDLSPFHFERVTENRPFLETAVI